MKRKVYLILLSLVIFSGIKTIYAELEYIGDKFRDPFKSYLPETDIGKSAATFSREISKLNLTGVIWGGDLPQAIINDKVYGVGDSILGVKIMEINKTGVLLQYKEDAYILKPK